MKDDNAERFERLLIALERELIEAADEEILEAARDLGMNPAMKGSAAFFGVTIASPHHWPEDSRDSAGAPRASRRHRDDPPT